MNKDLPPPSDNPQAPPGHPSVRSLPEQDRDDSEDPWKLALEGSGAGVWDWNLLTGAQKHSKRWEELLGYEAGELDKGYQEFITRVHPDDLAALNAAVSAYLEGRAPRYAIDVRLRCKDGSWKWILSRGMVVSHDAQGRPLRMIGTHTDITERKRTEAELRELNLQLGEKSRLLETTLASISQGIFMIDADQRVSTFNPRVCELLDLAESLLATRPTLQEITLYQLERGDFGPDASLVDGHARNYLAAGCEGDVPDQYLRVTPAGRTLEVKTQNLPSGGMVRTFADVSDYVQAETARKQLNQLLDATQSIARVGGWEADIANDKVFWTAGVYRLLETSPEEYAPTSATSKHFFTPAARALIKASYADVVKQPTTHDLELEMITAKGRHIWVHSLGTTTWAQGRAVKRTLMLQDITESKQAEAALRENEERWKLALESTGDGVWDWYIQSGEEFFSKRLKEMYGFGEDEILNRADAFDARTHPDDLAQLQTDRQAHFDGLTPTYINEHRVCCKDGSWKWVLTRGMVISRDAAGKPLRMIGTHTDITDRKRSEALIWQQAHFDALTGLPNRNMLRDRLEQEMKKSKRDGLQLAILFIDLDHFKEVNDTLGHDSGDLLLVEAARRIRSCVREADTVARMGGDEFTVLLTEVPDASGMERILQKLLQALEAVFQLDDELVFVSASIGITVYPLDGAEIEDLFKNADQALYAAKGAGRNRFSFFTPALQEAAQTRGRLANDLRTGLASQQFRVVYQPIVEMASGAIHKAEALIRWEHPTRGTVSPAAFIPIAEASGLIVDIGEWVFQQAAQQVQQWRVALNPHFQISVNKSPVQFHQSAKGNPPWGGQLRAMGLPGDSIVVEITEGLLLDTGASVANQLLALHDAGVQVSLDDFGTGYSSLSYLQKFDIDFIKIDQSFVRHLVAASTDLALCKAIIVMAHELGIKVIAEGVETAQQRDLLAAAGCDYAQGYLFARPMSAPDFEAFMARSI
ncbi:EAL domain-containing protein [Rhodoferax sp. UBA5149]|uniref:EAL domain-containing protein n=1 Tax=Rhodoferax sp. UBA5149 TaxID=1947379 RepID=UPI0025EF7DF3|nr:EAL domain-containing protein [Rhodoferax sp. UBA5149]